MSREAFEKWWDGYDLTKNNTVSSTTVLELLYDAWLARGEHDAKICEAQVRPCPEQFDHLTQGENMGCIRCAKAIREGDV